MDAQALVLTVAAAGNLLLGIVVFLKNSKSLSNIFFLFLSIFAGLWAFTNAIFRALPQEDAFVAALLSYFSASLLATLFVLFNYRFSGGNNKAIVWSVLVVGLLVSFLAAVPGVVAVGVDASKNIVTTNYLFLYGLYLVVFFFAGILILLRQLMIPEKQQQVFFMLIGLTVAVIAGLIFNLIFPLFGTYSYVYLGPSFTIVYIAFISYAIIKHKLFDIRPAIARTVAYSLSIFSVASFFAFSVFVLINNFSDEELKVTLSHQVLLTVTAVALAFIFQPVKKFFDRLSNSLFYRDAYDTQKFLDDFNKVLVSKADLEPMLQDATQVIGGNLKNSFTAFFIRKTQYIDTRLLGDDIKNFDEKDFFRIGELILHIHQAVIVLDELDGGGDLKVLMQKHDISVIARLVTTIEYDLEGVGFLVLGPKKSGSPYNRQDIKVIEIIANQLVIAIQNALRFEEIQEFNITLQQKVDDATKRLRRTNEKLEQMDETKDEFISMASHQLRTPLTSVKGYLSMVLEGDAGDIKPMQEKLLSQAFTSSQRMVYLIADLLNVSRLRTGKFVIEPIRANLADIAEGEVQQLQDTASSRQLTLQYDKPDEFPDLMLDETKIRQVIMNFIDNAIYYTTSNGTIIVELKDKKESVELTVTDTGMGVPKVDQPNLFTKFYRAGNAKKARPDGTGLGLFMAKKVIIEQGGAIIFKSKEGDGSTFGFTLPKAGLNPEKADEKTEN